MSERGEQRVRAVIVEHLRPALAAVGLGDGELPDDFDMRGQGVVDSLGFVVLLAEIERHLGLEIDLGDLDPESLTRVGPLARYIAGRYHHEIPEAGSAHDAGH